MIWVTRKFAIDGWFDVQDKFDQLWQALGSPRDMMLVGRNDRTMKKDIYMSLPKAELLSDFPGFESIAADSLPEAPSLITGNAAAFTEKFRFGVD